MYDDYERSTTVMTKGKGVHEQGVEGYAGYEGSLNQLHVSFP